MAIDRRAGTEYSGLALNVKGYERLAASGLDRLNFTLGATDSFSRRNANQSLDEALAAAAEVIGRSQLPVTLTISVAFGCPFEGRVDPGVVAEIAAQFASTEVVLASGVSCSWSARMARVKSPQPRPNWLPSLRKSAIAWSIESLAAST